MQISEDPEFILTVPLRSENRRRAGYQNQVAAGFGWMIESLHAHSRNFPHVPSFLFPPQDQRDFLGCLQHNLRTNPPSTPRHFPPSLMHQPSFSLLDVRPPAAVSPPGCAQVSRLSFGCIPPRVQVTVRPPSCVLPLCFCRKLGSHPAA